ncbi:MAG: hypothetical protein BGO77_02350 [Caedibacter sp. 37-49]|nr:MAG: hypothetical protein BGO77_02350 [Caedibacter sp. 37-49]
MKKLNLTALLASFFILTGLNQAWGTNITVKNFDLSFTVAPHLPSPYIVELHHPLGKVEVDLPNTGNQTVQANAITGFTKVIVRERSTGNVRLRKNILPPTPTADVNVAVHSKYLVIG